MEYERHGAYSFKQYNDTRLLYASPNNLGVSFWTRGGAHNERILFGISPEEASQLAEIADPMAEAVPELDNERQKYDAKERRQAANSGREPWPLRAKAPVVHALEESGEFEHTFLGGGVLDLDVPEELVALGSMKWTREQLIFEFQGVDTLLFRPDAFRELGRLAANQPAFPAKTSIWDNVR